MCTHLHLKHVHNTSQSCTWCPLFFSNDLLTKDTRTILLAAAVYGDTTGAMNQFNAETKNMCLTSVWLHRDHLHPLLYVWCITVWCGCMFIQHVASDRAQYTTLCVVHLPAECECSYSNALLVPNRETSVRFVQEHIEPT